MQSLDQLESGKGVETEKKPYRYSRGIVAFIIILTLLSYPSGTRRLDSTHYIWWCGYLTALATGLGAVPFYWIKTMDRFWLGVCNALAAGMMLAATCCLFYEGLRVNELLCPVQRVFGGAIVGIVFIKATKLVLDQYEDVHISNLDGIDARRVLLIMAVMTLHSISEGVGVGVSFGGEGGAQRGILVSITLAIHNIPEGLAISLALIPKGMSVTQAAMWSIFSSLPQPIFAVPSFLFVEHFLPLLPAGLGFAGGAMGYVACLELLPESLEETKDKIVTSTATGLAFVAMLTVQYVVKGNWF